MNMPPGGTEPKDWEDGQSFTYEVVIRFFNHEDEPHSFTGRGSSFLPWNVYRL